MDVASSQIESVFDGLKAVVLEKNSRYGNSALAPLNVFATEKRMNNAEIPIATKEIMTRLDDKLSRVKNSDDLRKNDIADIIGYIALLCVSCGWSDFSDLID